MSSKTAKMVLKKNKKLDKIYDPGTNLVFKSATERVVIGRIADDEFIPLDNEALELCEQNHYKYDESLVETEEKPEEEEKPDNSKEEKTSAQEDTEEKEVQKPVKSSKEDKKKSVELVSENKPVVTKAAQSDNTDAFEAILTRHTSELQDYFSKRETESQAYKERTSDLETQLSAMKKELDDVKKKLKGVLTAMQNEL